MSDKDNGGPAFPGGLCQSDFHDGDVKLPWKSGMSLRDFFAAHALAMSGVLAAGREFPTGTPMSAIANAAYLIADAMLAERSEP